ncbi:hypothetical protein GCM10010094_36760 [Streptomyces flaveus]|uniref:Uncharacterized protein n=1 Tax=Streptomyces flaveus TaxID=66370 RepID=A0A917QWA4_9ACTN|nr:hypothetical protein GCM10010094_36760 [Streptomyces flaveus]
MAPHDVVALAFQQNAAAGKLDPEATADENQQGRAFLTPHPLRSLVTTRVDTPLDLHRVAPARIPLALEVSEQPPAVKRRVPARIAHVHAVVHVAER